VHPSGKKEKSFTTQGRKASLNAFLGPKKRGNSPIPHRKKRERGEVDQKKKKTRKTNRITKKRGGCDRKNELSNSWILRKKKKGDVGKIYMRGGDGD